MSGEAASKTNLDIPGVQEELIKKISETGVPVVVVLMNGRPLTINWVSENIPAVIEAWYPGTQAGNAVAQVLFGEYNPSGKLPITFPRSTGQIPIYYYQKIQGDQLKKMISTHPNISILPIHLFTRLVLV
jgi:beta-glucosidase